MKLLFALVLAVVGPFIHAGVGPKGLPISDAVRGGDTLYVSGNIGAYPGTHNIPPAFPDEARQALKDLGLVLHAAGYDYRDVVKVNLYLTSMSDLNAWNKEYRNFFAAPNYPARTTVQVSALAFGAKLEVEAIAVRAK